MNTQRSNFLQRNGLSIAVLLFMLCTWVGQILTGHAVYDEELSKHGAPMLLICDF